MKRALIVEDSDSLRKLLEEFVWSMGIVPVPSGCVADAVAQVGPNVDMILLDLNLPNGHGFEVLRKVAEKRNDLPVIVLSAYVRDEQHEPPVPVLAWIEKPFGLTEVREAVERACNFSASVASIRRSTDRLERMGQI